MNRAQRRRSKRPSLKEAVEHLSAAPMSLNVIPTNAALLDPEIVASFAEFTKNVIQGERPLCLTCDYAWTGLDCYPPVAVATLRKHDLDRSNRTDGMFAVICEDCGKEDRLMERCLDACRHIWPDLHTVHVHPAPGLMQ